MTDGDREAGCRTGGSALSESALLVRFDARRAWSAIRRPRPGVWIGILVPVVLVAGALWTAGEGARPDLAGVGGAAVWGFVIAAPLSFFGYGVLFRPADDSFLRHLGLSGQAIFALRSLRLLLVGLVVAAMALIPFAATGVALGRPLAIAAGAVLLGWGATVLALATATRAAAPQDAARGPGFFSRLIKYDRELQRAGPLFYAPLAPLVMGTIGGGFVGAAAGASWVRVLGSAAVAGVMGLLGAPRFARALPRFAPHALEMAYSPPPEVGETGLVLNRGLARLLPHGAAAVRARDAAVAGRRFRWATGIVWPVSLAAAVGLARWGDVPGVRAWILLAGGVTLLAQAGAVIALGRLERSGARWIDRLVGLGWGTRWLGRWALGFGISLWLVVPLALVWTWWADGSAGWPWLIAGAAVAAVAASASLAAAGR